MEGNTICTQIGTFGREEERHHCAQVMDLFLNVALCDIPLFYSSKQDRRMRRPLSAAALLQLALTPLLLQQACALVTTSHSRHWHAPRSEVSRSSSPLLLAKRKGKTSSGSSAPGDEPPSVAAPEAAALDYEVRQCCVVRTFSASTTW